MSNTRNSRQGAIPSDIGTLIDDLADVKRRLDNLETPNGEAIANTVPRLANTVAELRELVLGLEARLDSYLETEAPAIIDARVATQVPLVVASILAGDVTIGGNLTVNGTTVKMSGVRGTDVSLLSDRVVVWVAGDGTVGHT